MNLPPLRGMLHKKHQHQRPLMNWGRRYFEVDDERGILYYFKTRAAAVFEEAKSAQPRVAQMELLALASAEADARAAADAKMERYLELEDMLAET